MNVAQAEIRNWIEENPLRAHRKGQGMTIADAAVKIGVSSMTIQFWENGSMKPGDDNMGRIAEFMGITAGEAATAWNNWNLSRPN